MKFTIATLALIGTQAVKISSERHHHRHQYGFSQNRSIPACNSFTFPKCVTEAETAAPKALQADQDKHDKDYFVPNFGVDHDIITTQSNLANAQKTLKHTWNIPAVAPSAAPAAAPAAFSQRDGDATTQGDGSQSPAPQGDGDNKRSDEQEAVLNGFKNMAENIHQQLEKSTEALSHEVFQNLEKFAVETLHVDPKVFVDGPQGGHQHGGHNHEKEGDHDPANPALDTTRNNGGPTEGGDHDPTMDTHDPTAPEHQGDGTSSKAQVPPKPPAKVNRADSVPPPPPTGNGSGASPSGAPPSGASPSGASPSGAPPLSNGNGAESSGPPPSTENGSGAPPSNPSKGAKAF